jgi:hypothetical protein
VIYVDQSAEPNEIARTLWHELGPEACIGIATTLAARSTGLSTFVLDLTGLEETTTDELA